ncbi:hypothetical protein [Bacillus sp. AFS017336]|uniref:hypothetical protein n=1 Tax=Bacillus sp. AFS017336 TaxID=2033489 RepID=UPI000BEF3D5F|nr:hypothetical protein [Bacillus sp. AFS017336]PEL12714.1 hypothetical protein CN601_07045 [Bacillus sp. AFS017336]
MKQDTKIQIGLTQFLEFTLKNSAAKMNAIRKIKTQTEYHPAFDYWKQLRDEIISFHKNNLDIDTFENLISRVDQRKKDNYIQSIKMYLKFIKGKETLWINPGKSHWIYEDLFIRSTPEVGIYIDNEPHLIKLYFKGKNEKVDRYNIASTLTMLNTSVYEKSQPEDIQYSVLNIQKGRLFSDNELNEDKLTALESEASQFTYIWNRIK